MQEYKKAISLQNMLKLKLTLLKLKLSKALIKIDENTILTKYMLTTTPANFMLFALLAYVATMTDLTITAILISHGLVEQSFSLTLLTNIAECYKGAIINTYPIPADCGFSAYVNLQKQITANLLLFAVIYVVAVMFFATTNIAKEYAEKLRMFSFVLKSAYLWIFAIRLVSFAVNLKIIAGGGLYA